MSASADGEVADYPWERPLGASPREDGSAEFRVWAPHAESIKLRLSGRDFELHDAGYGIYEAIADARPGDDYGFVVNGYELPDPSSRFQPDGIRGPSRVVELPAIPGSFATPRMRDLVIYELHIGTFTSEGTFEAAIEHLPGLAELGVTAIEIMPVAEYPGHHGWGYDGVYISAPQSSYGGPAGLHRLVAAAHDAGLAVILDVVYNHVGASGHQALEAFGPYFTGRYSTPWGKAINYDDTDCDPVREWVLQSATGWIRDFGIDGLRLDAIHAIFDQSAEHIVAAVARRVHSIRDDALVIAESGLNDPRVVRDRAAGGWRCDGAWADDFHHAVRTLVTGDLDGYYADFGSVAQLAKAWHRPYVYDGNYSPFRRHRYGAPADDVPTDRFVVFDQNHDQVGNRALGDRLPPEARPLAAFCTLLSPYVPMLFMGEEYGEEAPFQFFSDHIDPDIAQATREGRRAEFASFAGFSGQEIPDPQDRATFERSKLTRRRDSAVSDLYAELLKTRRRLPPGDVDAIEYDEDARWLRVRRGRFELAMNFAPEPRRVPSPGGESVVLATSEATAAEPAVLADGFVQLAALTGALIAMSGGPVG